MATASPHRRRLRQLALRCFGGLHRSLYRASNGRLGGSIRGMPVLLLTTTGRKSGKQRTAPLLFLRDGENLAVIASNGGSDWSPAWWLNLQSDPHAAVEIGPMHESVRARAATPDERSRLWARATEGYPGYAKYQQRTERQIPVVILVRGAE